MGKTHKITETKVKDDKTILLEANNSLQHERVYGEMRKFFYLGKAKGKQYLTFDNVCARYKDVILDCTAKITFDDNSTIVLCESNPLTSINESNWIKKFKAQRYLIYDTKKSPYHTRYAKESFVNILRRDILSGKNEGKLPNEHCFSINVATVVSLLGLSVTWIVMHIMLGAIATVLFLLAAVIASSTILYHTINYYDEEFT